MSTIFIDTETTGLSHEHDEVIEISIINQDGDILLDTLVKPVKKTEWPEAEDIHGISPESIAIANPPTLTELAPTIASILNEHDSAIVYNLDYDRPFILNAIHSADQGLKVGIDWQCAMLKFAEIYGEWDHRRGQHKWQRLTLAADHVGHEWQGQAHRALADCQATLSVWKWIQSTKALSQSTNHIDTETTTSLDLKRLPERGSRNPMHSPLTGAQRIEKERRRQITEKGYSTAFDAQYEDFETAKAAICYLKVATTNDYYRNVARNDPDYLSWFKEWPFDSNFWKPSKADCIGARIKELTKAGALIAAQIDSLDIHSPNHTHEPVELPEGGWLPKIKFCDHTVPYINTTVSFDEIADKYSKDHAFVIMYFETLDRRVYELRSKDAGEDVSVIANKFGGDGHKNAAGFSIPKDHLLVNTFTDKTGSADPLTLACETPFSYNIALETTGVRLENLQVTTEVMSMYHYFRLPEYKG